MKEAFEKIKESMMERGCDNCRHMTKGVEQYPCNQCINNYGEIIDKWEQRTNADRIRSMSDEELAEFFNQHDCVCDFCTFNMGCLQQETVRCKEGFLNWLKSPTND